MVGLTRRGLLARGAVAGAGLVVGGCGGAQVASRPASAAASDLRLLSRAVEAEFQSTLLYEAVLPQRESDGALVRRIRAAEERHGAALAEAVTRLGGELGDQTGGVVGELGLEEALAHEERTARRYLDLLPRLVVPSSRTLVAFILAEEAAHLSALRAALGRDPVPGALL